MNTSEFSTSVDKQIEIACGCCTEHYPEGLMVKDDDFGLICPTCDLACAEAEWDGKAAAQDVYGEKEAVGREKDHVK